MPRVVIDTNIIVSALIQKSYPFLIIDDLFLNDLVEVCISEEVIEEYFAVLNRKKFLRYPGFVVNAEAFLISLEFSATKFQPKNRLTLLKDAGDNKFLELCEESHADYLITGNTKDFTILDFTLLILN
ncbi:MAG: putative toxin-antitoxin system toxin component, PIN family [Bacteroidetes bacterium]|nr:putative toxin-antitoxin system toxin component, PIN family [Bacteroidota bacterium]